MDVMKFVIQQRTELSDDQNGKEHLIYLIYATALLIYR